MDIVVSVELYILINIFRSSFRLRRTYIRSWQGRVEEEYGAPMLQDAESINIFDNERVSLVEDITWNDILDFLSKWLKIQNVSSLE